MDREIVAQDVWDKTDVLCFLGESAIQVPEKEGKVVFFLDEKNPYFWEDFQKFVENHLFKRFSFISSSKYSSEEKQRIDQLFLQCQMIQWNIHLQASEYQDFGVRVFHNLCENFLRASHRDLEKETHGIFRGIPAIICGAGASLDLSFPFLKQVAQKALVFSGGAALSMLTNHDIAVSIAAGIDPDPSWNRCLMHGSFEVPFFYQDRFSSDLLDQMQGPLFEMPSVIGLHIGRKGFLEGGPTVSTFCAALAAHFGCSPIIFAGVDLAYERKDKKYGGNTLQQEEQDLVFYEGKWTQKDWVIAAKWLEDLTARYPSLDFCTISVKGLDITGIRKVCWEELFATKLIRSFDLKGMISTLTSCGTFGVSECNIQEIKNIEESFSRVFIILEKVLALFAEAYPEDPSSKKEYVIHLFALYEEIVYQQLLEPIWKAWSIPIEQVATSSYEKTLHKWLFFKQVIEAHQASKEKYAKGTV